MMMQDTESYKDIAQEEAEALFEIDFDAEQRPQVNEDQKKKIYQELMSLDW